MSTASMSEALAVRTFAHLRELVSVHKELALKLNQLEREVGAHDRAIAELINAIREPMIPAEPKKKRPIGFAPWQDNTPHSGLLRRRLST